MDVGRVAANALSCDTFVVLPPKTLNGGIIFGKNSDRPESEVQEVVFHPASDHNLGDTVMCTYIEVPAVAHNYSVILSKPAWIWGAEMGANEHGVCIGNEAVFTMAQDAEEDAKERLLGMDLVRLGLERSKTAREALDVITKLLEDHGQGGRCFEAPERASLMYNNSFVIVDYHEAWVLETVGNEWAAEHIISGFRNVSNQLSIGTKIDLMSSGLKNLAKEKGWWDGNGEFHFANIFQKETIISTYGKLSPASRYNCGKDLLENFSKNNQFDVMSMMNILRDTDSGICQVGEGALKAVSTGSQVSLIYPAGKKASCHWFTATPNPACSVFKPFIFVPDVEASSRTVSPTYGNDDPVKVKPRFESQVDRQHVLYKAHKAAIKPVPGDEANTSVLNELMLIEKYSIRDVEEFIENYDEAHNGELKDLFEDSVDTEIKFYKNC